MKIISSLTLFVLTFLLGASILHAQIYIEVMGGSDRKYPIAVPEFMTEGGNHNASTEELTSLVKKDLKIAGVFKVLDEASFLQKDNDVREIDFSKWKALEAHALIKGVVKDKGGKVTMEIRLYDVTTQQMLLGKQYSVSKKDNFAAIHKFMDELMKNMTGARGPFDSRIAAACGRQGTRQISYFAPDGTDRGGVRIKGNNISPNWSSDGRIVFTSFSSYYPEVFVSSGGKVKQLTNFKSTTITPIFSPDGSRIVFASSKSGDTDLYMMSSSGKQLGRVTNVVNIDVSPTWSPDGSRIVFASERSGGLHLYSTGADGGGASRLTYVGYQNDQPDWSPDGKKIVFTSRDRGAFDIFMMNSDGSFLQRLTMDEGNNESPTWSPDSRYIAFSRGGSGIYVMLGDGNNQTPIPDTAGCINPDWGSWVD